MSTNDPNHLTYETGTLEVSSIYRLNFNNYTPHNLRIFDFFAGIGIEVKQEPREEVPMDFYYVYLDAAQLARFEEHFNLGHWED